MFLLDHFYKWALSAILAANVAEEEKEISASDEDEEELEARESEESLAKDEQNRERKPK